MFAISHVTLILFVKFSLPKIILLGLLLYYENIIGFTIAFYIKVTWEKKAI